MLARIAPRFVISRVIQNAYHAEAMCVELLKQPFGFHEEYFSTVDPSHYYPTLFYGYISAQQKPTSFDNKYEEAAYGQAVEKLALFNEIHAIVDKLVDFNNEARTLYSYVERNASSSNFFSRSDETKKEFEVDVLDAIDRFQALEDSLAPYPEWKNKVTEEIGHWFHLIHNNMAESEGKRNIFLRMNRQEYFV